ncbi:MAG TPA: sensor domain-containing diguanylate cyclase [Terriglobales bacterium]|nr:sensor domain-containing diguanylate cyclase [Terriglobales bacterium]
MTTLAKLSSGAAAFSGVPSDANFYKELLDHMSDGVYFVDRDRRILFWNDRATRLTGYKSEEVMGRFCQDEILCHVDGNGKRLCHDGCPLTATIADGEAREAQVFLRHKKGRRVPVLVRVQPIHGDDGSVIGAVEIFSDETARLAAARKTKEMERLAFLDQLTQLPNRRYLEMSVKTALAEFQIHGDAFGVLVIDVDRFKAINDGFGHSTGDKALQEAARTLTGALRTTDIVGRWGGDEFLAVVRHVDQNIMKHLADRCCALMSQSSIVSAAGTVKLSVSVGGAVAGREDSADSVISRADELMYRSKAEGRGRSAVAGRG